MPESVLDWPDGGLRPKADTGAIRLLSRKPTFSRRSTSMQIEAVYSLMITAFFMLIFAVKRVF